MKIRVLIKENLDKIYNILDLIKQNQFLAENAKNVKYFNENNWTEIFEKAVQEIKINKEFQRLCIFDDDGMLPFVFFSKQKGVITACPNNVDRAILSRAHNNANCIIMSCKNVKSSDMNNILTTFFVTKNEGGRHATRVRLMQEPYKNTDKTYKFDENKSKTIIVCSDHAGFTLKESIKKYLIEQKGLNVIDVGCSSSNSSHYPLFAVAMVLNANKGCCGIAFCSTGVGIANTLNKFKGINAIICASSEQAKIARNKYDANVLALGAKELDFAIAKETVDQFLATNKGNNKLMLPMDKYGYDFDFEAFKKIPIDSNIEVPKELK